MYLSHIILCPPSSHLGDSRYPSCYVLSMSQDGATHPLAANRELDGGSALGFSTPSDDVEIVGDLIGWTVLGMDICMNVYNWKTGAALWCDSEFVSGESCKLTNVS